MNINGLYITMKAYDLQGWSFDVISLPDLLCA